MDQFVSILLTSLFVNLIHQMVLHILAHEQVIILFVIQCKNFARFIFNRKTSIIDVLIKVSLLKLFKDAFTAIIDKIGLNLVRIKKVRCVWNINSAVTMFVHDFGEGIDAGNEIQFIYISVQAIDASLLITMVLIEFGVFIPEFIIYFICIQSSCFSYKLIIIVDLKYHFVICC